MKRKNYGIKALQPIKSKSASTSALLRIPDPIAKKQAIDNYNNQTEGQCVPKGLVFTIANECVTEVKKQARDALCYAPKALLPN
ncbi:uncharacterized protein PpBr36_06768 [Pyricularia pennisetigena]|uniref:uncharacterized protein n=1 Tax=Pyricularia pennisetigena TaxID=1578925 RepID=UPI001154E536|nr:uncharacterized protein PpBr36_06768 [Pyricularia pennisetigena]TLS22682.1 hypothetical protein PpBr36_06768 [Pyricularia pennisetigena]